MSEVTDLEILIYARDLNNKMQPFEQLEPGVSSWCGSRGGAVLTTSSSRMRLTSASAATRVSLSITGHKARAGQVRRETFVQTQKENEKEMFLVVHAQGLDYISTKISSITSRGKELMMLQASF